MHAAVSTNLRDVITFKLRYMGQYMILQHIDVRKYTMITERHLSHFKQVTDKFAKHVGVAAQINSHYIPGYIVWASPE